MKYLLTIFTLVFTVMFSSTSFAEWTEVGQSVDGDTYYVDFERIRKVDGYVYYWSVVNLPEPDQTGNFSYKVYFQGDCKLFRHKWMHFTAHKELMGEGVGPDATLPDKWQYPPPNSVNESLLNTVCSL